MNNFEITQKTTLYFGTDYEKKVGDKIKKYSNSCLLVHDGGKYLNDILRRVKASLEDAGVSYLEFSQVRVNPLLSIANEAIEIVRRNRIGFILAIGGGSVMDTAKYIAIAANGEKSAIEGIDKGIQVIPHGVIVTLPGTGSEFSSYIMIIDDLNSAGQKSTINDPEICFDFAIINPTFAYSLPKKQVAAGSLDIIIHCWETYLADSPNCYLMEGYFENIVKVVLEIAPKAIEDPVNYDVRANLNIAAMMAMMNHMAYAAANQDWVIHHLENPITTQFKRTHGEVLGIMALAWIKYNYKNNVAKYYRWAVNCMGAEEHDDKEETIEAGLFILKSWIEKVGLPVKLSEIGVTERDFQGFVEAAAPAGFVTQLSKEKMLEVYRLAK